MREAIPEYDAFQDAVADAGADILARRILDLGTGTGRPRGACSSGTRARGWWGSTRVSGCWPSPAGCSGPRPSCGTPGSRPAPAGPFDLVVSALAVHHLDRAGKADLATRVRAVLEPGGAFVVGDVIVPDDPADAVTPLDRSVDLPERLDDLLGALREGGLRPSLAWRQRDLAVVLGRADLTIVPPCRSRPAPARRRPRP